MKDGSKLKFKVSFLLPCGERLIRVSSETWQSRQETRGAWAKGVSGDGCFSVAEVETL